MRKPLLSLEGEDIDRAVLSMFMSGIRQAPWNPDGPFDNADPAHRAALISALLLSGFEAYEHHSGGGVSHVAVDLYHDRTGVTSDCLMIVTGSVVSPCDVSMMGWRNGGNVESEEWIGAPTIDDAVAAFHKFWGERGIWLERFERGDLDL